MNKKLLSVGSTILIFALLRWQVQGSEDTIRQVIIHFTRVPNDEHHHKNLSEIIEESLDPINQKLVSVGLIAPILYTPPPTAPLKERLRSYLQKSYYQLFYRLRPLQYPNKLNRAFFTRENKSLGIYSMFVPDGIAIDDFIKYLHEIYAQKGVEFHIDPDMPVRITQNSAAGLEGLYFTDEELKNVQQKQLPERVKRVLTKKQLPESRVFNALLWHLSFPTVGVTLKEPFYPPPYPFLPHYFSLWQLAPKQGAGIRVAVIDTGVAAYQVQDNRQYLKNESLKPVIIPGQHNFNIVSSYGLDPLEQFLHLIKNYIEPTKFNEEYLEAALPSWIKEYLIQNSDLSIRNYLIENGKSEYVSNKQLTDAGKNALQLLLTGDQGIKPKNPELKPPFTIAKLIKPVEMNVILQFLPAPHITSEPITFVAGHGTHTYGLVSAQDIGNGVTGIAPKAVTFMIKGFNDDGTSDQSTLLTALKKAIIHQTDVANLSLKVANELDMTDKTAQLIERVLKLIPYVVAASGNDGDPAKSELTNPVEAYPARFDTVAFDVGAFAYEENKTSIPLFSQYEPNIGPLFVAPGFDILSTAIIPGQTVESMYMFLAGTSMAAPIISGFTALMLAEFKDQFTREQLLKVCYLSTIRLANTDDWKLKVILGALDMRTALLTFHVLVKVKQEAKTINFDQKFDQLLAAVNYLLFADADTYSKKYLKDINFKNDYIGYLNAAIEHKDKLANEKYFVPESVEAAVGHIAQMVLDAINLKNGTTDEKLKKVNELLSKDSINLFGDLAPSIQKRIAAKDTIDEYWLKQAEQLKKRLVQEDILEAE